MAIGFGRAHGVTLNARSALKFGATHALKVLRLVWHMILRLLAGLVPFALAAGLVYMALLREHDINYYLSRRPREFVIAEGLVAFIGIGLALMLARTIVRWALALPLVLFENVHPRRALHESAKRVVDARFLILCILVAWIVVASVLFIVATSSVDLVGRVVAPQLASSLVLLLLFIAVLALVGVVLTLAVSVVNFSLFAMLLTRLYLRLTGTQVSASAVAHFASSGPRRFSGRERAAILVVALLAAVGIGLLGFLVNRGQKPALVIAHRGASATTPENTLAAFRLAAEQHTDFVELDVQESADGQVLVVHDSDLMKVGRDATKIWEGDAAQLRAVDIGSYSGPQFSAERVPHSREALATCKGRCRVVVELKSATVTINSLKNASSRSSRRQGWREDWIFMSLDHEMMRNLKALRPSWRVGLLVAKAMGDLTELKADFLAVEARMATRRFVRRAHRAGQEVYIWTVNDAAWMLLGLSRGVDGLITDKPDLARAVIERRAAMSNAERFLVAQLIRLGASTEALEAETALRP